jgi:putative FmdB family regulatory protein
MPTYDWRCNNCDHRFEHAQPSDWDSMPRCPECTCRDTEKIIAAPGIALKGEGWARDGYAKGGEK